MEKLCVKSSANSEDFKVNMARKERQIDAQYKIQLSNSGKI